LLRTPKEVDQTGRCIVSTCTRELAELKQEQIHAFGPDKLIRRCQGSMSAEIEPAE
jgi:ATP-dependent Clp protease adaptor protein ClpS